MGGVQEQVGSGTFVVKAFNISSRDTLPIGIDLGSSAAKLAQLRLLKDGLELLALGKIEKPQDIGDNLLTRLDFLAQNIPRVLKASQFKGRRCILSLPAEHTFVRHVKVPKLDPQATALAVRKATQSELPYPINEAVVRHVIAGDVHCEGGTRQEVIAVAVPLATMDAYLEMTNRVGLEVVGVNVEPLTLVHCFSSLFDWGADPAKAVLYVDMGSVSTQVVIAHGPDVAFARNLPRGSRQLVQAVAENTAVPPEQECKVPPDVQEREGYVDCKTLAQQAEEWVEATSQNIEHCLRYYEAVFRKSSVERIVFTGGQARDRGICQLLAKRLNLPAQIGNPAAAMQIGQNAANVLGQDEQANPSLAVAIGLSLGGLKENLPRKIA